MPGHIHASVDKRTAAADRSNHACCCLCKLPAPAQAGTPRVCLQNPTTWPAGGQRRNIECVPPGGGGGGGGDEGVKGCASGGECMAGLWGQLVSAPRLVAGLDALLGRAAWELPPNGRFEPGQPYVRCVGPRTVTPLHLRAASACAPQSPSPRHRRTARTCGATALTSPQRMRLRAAAAAAYRGGGGGTHGARYIR